MRVEPRSHVVSVYPMWDSVYAIVTGTVLISASVLSAGHASMLIYSLLHLYGELPHDEIVGFRTLGSKTAGHPEYDPALSIETTTGPLGQGVSNAVGMALAEKVLANQVPSG